MVDDLLVAYASARLMIMNHSSLVSTTVDVKAFSNGSGLYIYLTFAINTLVVLLLAEEPLRTRGWKDVLYFDYADPRSLMIGASKGGYAIAHAVEKVWTGRMRSIYRYSSTGIGIVRVTLYDNHTSIVLDTDRSHQKELPRIPSHDD